jgi:hypothetical protein
MRTNEQLNNLREVFCKIYTPFAILWPDEAVDRMADKIQSDVNATAVWNWEIRVLAETDFVDSWLDVKPEPTIPCCTVSVIKKKCEELLKKYPSIVSIMIVAKENRKLVFQFPS